MNANDLNKFIIIEKEVTTTNSLGTPIETYSFLKESYAGVWLKGGSTQYTDGAIPFTNIEFVIRYDERVDYKCRVKYEGQYYKIKHIYVQGRKDWMRLQAIVWEKE